MQTFWFNSAGVRPCIGSGFPRDSKVAGWVGKVVKETDLEVLSRVHAAKEEANKNGIASGYMKVRKLLFPALVKGTQWNVFIFDEYLFSVTLLFKCPLFSCLLSCFISEPRCSFFPRSFISRCHSSFALVLSILVMLPFPFPLFLVLICVISSHYQVLNHRVIPIFPAFLIPFKPGRPPYNLMKRIANMTLKKQTKNTELFSRFFSYCPPPKKKILNGLLCFWFYLRLFRNIVINP